MWEATSTLITVREIARGGLGTVELVLRREGRFERVCAVKRPHPHLLGDSQMVELFLEEGRLAGMLRHPNVVPVFDVGRDQRGPYMLMDFIEAVTVGELIRHVRSRGDLLPVSIVVQIAIQAASGLRAAHELVGVDGASRPLVHRDVSPPNLLVGHDGIVRVVDFGIAKMLDADRPETTAVLKGKCGYMSPEQLRFESVDARADLFALGVVLFEALSGERLYGGGSIQKVAPRILHDPPPELSEVRGDAPPALERLLLEMLSKDREHRVPSAQAVLERLEAIAIELREDEDWVDLRTFLDSELGDERDQERRRRASEIDEARERTDTRVRRGRATRRRRSLAVVAVVAVALSLVGWTVFRDDTEQTSAVAPLPSPPVVSASAPEPPPESVPEPIEPETVEEASGAPVEAPATMRRRRRTRPASRTSPASMGLVDDFW